MVSLVILAYHDQITWCFRYETNQDGEYSGRDGFAPKHIAPAGGDGP